MNYRLLIHHKVLVRNALLAVLHVMMALTLVVQRAFLGITLQVSQKQIELQSVFYVTLLKATTLEFQIVSLALVP